MAGRSCAGGSRRTEEAPGRVRINAAGGTAYPAVCGQRRGPRRSADSTICPSCSAEVVAGLPFCPECGKRVVQTPTGPACARCGTAASESTKFCPACGLDLTGRVSQQRVSAERLATGPASQYALVLLDESGAVARGTGEGRLAGGGVSWYLFLFRGVCDSMKAPIPARRPGAWAVQGR